MAAKENCFRIDQGGRIRTCLLLAVLITIPLASCDSGGASSNEQAVSFPSTSRFGQNLLSGEVDTALASDDISYSMRAEKNSDVKVRMVLNCTGGCEDNDWWERPINSQVGWASEDGSGSTEEWILVQDEGDAKMSFSGTDTLQIEIFTGESDELLKEMSIPWKPE